jgi:hypothetical protein
VEYVFNGSGWGEGGGIGLGESFGCIAMDWLVMGFGGVPLVKLVDILGVAVEIVEVELLGLGTKNAFMEEEVGDTWGRDELKVAWEMFPRCESYSR